jgi:hypothetical protein
MFSTNFLIFVLEWLHGKFEATSHRHASVAADYKALANKYLAEARERNAEAERANKFAGKIANFLE